MMRERPPKEAFFSCDENFRVNRNGTFLFRDSNKTYHSEGSFHSGSYRFMYGIYGDKVIEISGALLKTIRKKLGLSEEDMEERSGISVRTIRKLENGDFNKLRSDTIRKLLWCYGIRVADFQLEQRQNKTMPELYLELQNSEEFRQAFFAEFERKFMDSTFDKMEAVMALMEMDNHFRQN